MIRQRSTPTLQLVASVALALWALACSSGKAPGTAAGVCAKTSDCAAGQVCSNQVCKDLPCDGKCTTDQACLNDVCKAASGLDCSKNVNICPAAFSCFSGHCRRSCTQDQDCPSPLLCNVDNFVCAECNSNRECTERDGADPARPFCETTSGSCVGCLDNTSCYVNAVGAGLYCDSATQSCLKGCNSVTDCPSGTKSCLGGTQDMVGACIQCQADSDCLSPQQPHCDKVSNACVECTDGGQCSSNQCDAKSHHCVECTTDTVCQRGFVCNPSSFKCVPGCVNGSGGAQCPPIHPACDPARGPFGGCVTCLLDSDCPREQTCDQSGASPSCVPGCHSDAQCASTNAAVTNTTCDKAKGSNGTCVQCRSDADCPEAQVCDKTSELCRCKKEGETCTGSSECGYEEVPGPNGTTKVDCNATHAFCITQVECNHTTDKSVTPVCTTSVKGAGLANHNPPDGTGCPSGFVVEYATDGQEPFTVVCVPNKSPYTCP